MTLYILETTTKNFEEVPSDIFLLILGCFWNIIVLFGLQKKTRKNIKILLISIYINKNSEIEI